MKRQNEVEETIRQVMQTMVEVANSHQRTNSILETLAEGQRELVEGQRELVEGQRELVERQRETEESLNKLSQKQAITEENLNVLLLTVERHIAGH